MNKLQNLKNLWALVKSNNEMVGVSLEEKSTKNAKEYTARNKKILALYGFKNAWGLIEEIEKLEIERLKEWKAQDPHNGIDYGTNTMEEE